MDDQPPTDRAEAQPATGATGRWMVVALLLVCHLWPLGFALAVLLAALSLLH